MLPEGTIIPTEHGAWGYDPYTGKRTLAWLSKPVEEDEENRPWLYVLLVNSDTQLEIDPDTPFEVVFEDDRVEGISYLQTAIANSGNFPEGGAEHALRCLMRSRSAGVEIHQVTLVLGGFSEQGLEEVLSKGGDKIPAEVRRSIEEALKRARAQKTDD